MSNQVFATKGNLINSKKSLELAKMGYDLMDRKRNVLIREMMSLVDKVKILRDDITQSYSQAYYLLQQANVSNGLITSIANQVHIEKDVQISYRSVMGIEVPTVIYEHKEPKMEYGFEISSSRVDEAFVQFNRVKDLTMILAEVDNSVYRLANAIRKTQKRANALKNIFIPNLEDQIKFITEALEEKEREEFSRLKVIKSNKQKNLED
ncbi:MAG: V-type ATP synthase subunit D [Tissierellia bacterium]|nr:V-type ATP synthase subunit D [Tissierellia bacterium]